MALELPQSPISRELSLFDQLAEKLHNQGLSLFDLTIALFFEKNSTHRAFVEIIGGICLTLQLPEVAFPVVAHKRLTKNFKGRVRYQ